MKSAESTALGPIAKKLLKSLDQLRAQKVHSIELMKGAKLNACEAQKTVASAEELFQYSSTHAAYIWIQNQASVLTEFLVEHPAMKPFYEKLSKAEDLYAGASMGPPMSPITNSFYVFWSMFDLSVGAKKETVGTCILALADSIGMSPYLKKGIEILQASRNGIYQVERTASSKSGVQLKELITDEVFEVDVPSGYTGEPGELWLTRLLPPLTADSKNHLVIQTPYAIIETDINEWKKYFEKTRQSKFPGMGVKTSYSSLMKWGLEPYYWTEYIFESYVNYCSSAVFLTGYPHIAKSRPLSKINWDQTFSSI